MKKYLAALMVLILLLASGCDFKVDRDRFYLPQEQVESVEIQREYHKEDEVGTYFRHKVLTKEADREKVCDMIRDLAVHRASLDEPHPITEFSIIIIIGGEREHHVILNEDIMYYDQIAYQYSKDGIFQKFVELYNGLDYAETDTEPNRF